MIIMFCSITAIIRETVMISGIMGSRKALALAAAPGLAGLSMSQAAATYHDMAPRRKRKDGDAKFRPDVSVTVSLNSEVVTTLTNKHIYG